MAASPLRAYLGVEALSKAELRVVLLDAAEEAERLIPKLLEQQGIGAQVRAAQLSLVLREIRAMMAALFGDVGRIVQEGRLDAAEAAANGEDVLLDYLRSAGLEDQAETLQEAFTAQARQGFASIRAKAANDIPLSSQVYRTQAWATGLVNRTVTRGLLLGNSAKEIAKAVSGMINPNVKGGVSYAAFRLGRTELNHAFKTAQEERYAGEPWTLGMQWHLSGSHPAPDICNVLADQDAHGLGAGIYPVGERPNSHPNCLCYLTPQQLDEDQFVDAFLRGEYDDYLDTLDGAEDIPRQAPVDPQRPKNVVVQFPTPPPPLTPQATGTNVLDWVAEETRDGNVDNPFNAASDLTDPRDASLMHIGQQQGFDGLPAQGSVDEEVAQGGAELWRGVVPFKGSGSVPARTSEELVRGFEEGDYGPGTGIYGNGFYYSVSRRVAEHFAEGGDAKSGKRKVQGGSVVRHALRRGARVVDYEDLLAMQREWMDGNRDRFMDMTDLFAANFVAPPEMLNPNMQAIMQDPGRFAAALGYDAIRVTGKQDGAPFVKGEPGATNPSSGSKKKFSAHVQYIVLNRTAVLVEATP